MRIHCSSNISKTLLMFLAVLLFANECDSSKEETKLVKELLRGYESTIRPVARFQDLITVNFSLALQQIVDLDEKNQLLTTSMYMTWSWMDSHLQWEPEEHDNITFLRLPAKKVWKPDILVYNSAVDSFDQMLHTNVIVEHSGKVEWLPPGLFKTTCDVDIAYFPFDEQKCKIKFGAWTHHGDLVDLNIPDEGNADTSAYIESGEWDLKSMVGQRNYVKYDCCPNPFVDITFTIHMQRRTLFYGFNLILPCVLVCSLTILIFLLPADSGERITLGITVLLSLTVFLLLVADIIPPTSLTTPLISKYFACSIVMVTLSVIATVVSLNFHHTSAATIDEMPMWIEVVFLKFLPTILLMKMPGLQKTQTATENNRTEGEPLIKVGERLGNWRSDQLDGSDPTSRTALQQLRREERQISEMCRDLHDIVQRKRDEDEDEKIALKWRFAATVLDRANLSLSEFSKCTDYCNKSLSYIAKCRGANSDVTLRITGEIHLCRGSAYLRLGSFRKTLEDLERSLTLATSQHNAVLECMACCALGRFYISLKDYEKATFFPLKAAEILSENDSNPSHRTMIQIHLAEAYRKVGKLTEAMACSEEAMKCAIETSDRGSQAYCLLCFADIHRTRKDSERARPRYESAGALMVEIGDRYGEVKVMVGKAKVNLKSKNYAAALELYEAALKIAQSINAKMECLGIFGELAVLQQRVNNLDEARICTIKYHELLDELDLYCGACLKPIAEKHEQLEALSCSHVFHLQCVSEMGLINTRACPNCRKLMSKPTFM